MICKTNTSICVCGKDNPCKVSESMTKEIKIGCDDCKFVDNCVDYGWQGCGKFTQKPSEPMTNEEWFTSLPTEEKAEFLKKIIQSCGWCLDGGNPPYCLLSGNKCFFHDGDFVEWLKEKHHD